MRLAKFLQKMICYFITFEGTMASALTLNATTRFAACLGLAAILWALVVWALAAGAAA
jgi:hypothetical protein